MTTLVRTEIPPAIATVEQLVAWCGMQLERTTGTRALVEVDGGLPEFVAQAPIARDPSGSPRLVVRVNLELDPVFTSDKTKKLWLHVKELIQGSIPAEFKVD